LSHEQVALKWPETDCDGAAFLCKAHLGNGRFKVVGWSDAGPIEATLSLVKDVCLPSIPAPAKGCLELGEFGDGLDPE